MKIVKSLIVLMMMFSHLTYAEEYFSDLPSSFVRDVTEILLVTKDKGLIRVKKLELPVFTIKESRFISFLTEEEVEGAYLLDQQLIELTIQTVTSTDRDQIVNDIKMLSKETRKTKEDEEELLVDNKISDEQKLYQNLLSIKLQLEKLNSNNVATDNQLSSYRAQLYSQQISSLITPEGIKSPLANEVIKLRAQKIQIEKEYKKLVKEYEG